MSQYPGPYNAPPPPYGLPQAYAPYGSPDPLRPARAASILMFIIGGFFLLCGACFTLGSFVPFDQLPPEQTEQLGQLQEQVSALGVSLKQFFIIAGIMLLVPAVIYVVLGALIRRGRLWVVITSMIVASLNILFVLFQLFGGIRQAMQDPRGVVGLCMAVIPLALLGLLMYFLVGAARSAGQVEAMRQAQQNQYWQFQQNQQTYGQPGYGAPPMQPPPPPPPPPDQQR